MATYQYKVYLIPRKSIAEKYSKIPSQLFIDLEAWEKHWAKESVEDVYDFEDALTIEWWKERGVLFEPIEPLILKFAKQVKWTMNSLTSKSYGNNETNDISIDLTEDFFIKQFSFRIDLRKLDRKFIDNIFSIAQQLDCLLLDRKGNLFEPIVEVFLKYAHQSSAFLFVENPSDYLYQLSNGTLKPE